MRNSLTANVLVLDSRELPSYYERPVICQAVLPRVSYTVNTLQVVM